MPPQKKNAFNLCRREGQRGRLARSSRTGCRRRGDPWIQPTQAICLRGDRADAGDAGRGNRHSRVRQFREPDRQSKLILWDLKKAINLQFPESFMVDDVCHSPMAINEGGDCCFMLEILHKASGDQNPALKSDWDIQNPTSQDFASV